MPIAKHAALQYIWRIFGIVCHFLSVLIYIVTLTKIANDMLLYRSFIPSSVIMLLMLLLMLLFVANPISNIVLISFGVTYYNDVSILVATPPIERVALHGVAGFDLIFFFVAAIVCTFVQLALQKIKRSRGDAISPPSA